MRQIFGWIGLLLYGLTAVVALIWGGDILRAGLDPGVPFQTYRPPPAPDYSRPDSWALNEAREPGGGVAAIFFIHPTTYVGGREWNGPINEPAARRELADVILPNYAKPFSRAGAVSAPFYRQSSLYTRLSLREDAREARAFAYGDVERAFGTWLARHPDGPIVVAGVEQGGELGLRLIQQRITPDPTLRSRLVAAYLMDTAVLADGSAGIAPCDVRSETGCMVVWSKAQNGDEWQVRRIHRNLVWEPGGEFKGQDNRPLICVNPVTGAADQPLAERRRHLGAVDATGLEWTARPAFLPRQFESRCEAGILRYERPASDALRGSHGWVARRKVQPYNLFYADIESDIQARLQSWLAQAAA